MAAEAVFALARVVALQPGLKGGKQRLQEAQAALMLAEAEGEAEAGC